MNKPTAVSFFCGAGGMDLGFIEANFNILAAWDWDSNAIKSYVENIGDHANVMDIKEMTYDDIPAADVWINGSPCQDVSVAGKGAGLIEGARSSMFFHVMRLLQEVREIEPDNLPKVILTENVKGMKKYLHIIEEEYAKQGYKFYNTLFNSKYWGVPQNRERYFMVGIREDLPQTFEYLDEQHDYVPKLSSILETEVDEKYYISDDKAAKIIEQAMERLETLGSVHPCITPDRVDKRQNGRRAKEEEADMYTLTAQDLHGIIVLGRLDMKGHDVIRRVYDPEGIAPTLTTSEGGHRQPKILEGYRVRKLTPREYARLQGFPDTYKLVCSNRQLYKQFGNAVSVPVAKAIAEAINRYLESLKPKRIFVELI